MAKRLNKSTVDELQPAEKPYIVYDDKLTGFAIRVMPSGVKIGRLNTDPFQVGVRFRSAVCR